MQTTIKGATTDVTITYDESTRTIVGVVEVPVEGRSKLARVATILEAGGSQGEAAKIVQTSMGNVSNVAFSKHIDSSDAPIGKAAKADHIASGREVLRALRLIAHRAPHLSPKARLAVAGWGCGVPSLELAWSRAQMAAGAL